MVCSWFTCMTMLLVPTKSSHASSRNLMHLFGNGHSNFATINVNQMFASNSWKLRPTRAHQSITRKKTMPDKGTIAIYRNNQQNEYKGGRHSQLKMRLCSSSQSKYQKRIRGTTKAKIFLHFYNNQQGKYWEGKCH